MNYGRCYYCHRSFDSPNQYTYGDPASQGYKAKENGGVPVCRNKCPALHDTRRLKAWELAVKDWA